MMTDILLIAAMWVFVLDISGFWDEITTIISGWLTNGKIRKPFQFKPFSCSLCMSFWSGLLYLLLTHSLTIPAVAYVCLVAYMTPVIADLLHFVTETLKTLIIKINSFINE